jgi:hypothetical protein
MTTETFTLVHVVLSLVGIGSGFIVLFGLLSGKRLDGLTTLFLVTTVATSVTGFGFPVDHLMPSHIVRRIYVIGAVMALYFNVFVLVVQAFRRVPALNAMAPTQSEPPFLVAQLVVMAFFIWLGIAATKRFRNELVLKASV